MAKSYVKGDAVENATSYELLEEKDGAYTSLTTQDSGGEINIEVSALGLAAGDHNLVVKAKADGYEDSEYSDPVVYTVEAGEVASYVGAEAFCNTGIRIVEDTTSDLGWKQTTSGTSSFATDLIPVTSENSVWLQYVWNNRDGGSQYICIGLYDTNETLVGVVAPSDFGLAASNVNFLTPEENVCIGDIESRDGISVAYVRFIAWAASEGGQANTEARIYTPA